MLLMLLILLILHKFTYLGGYKILKSILPEVIVPDLTDCELKPYVAKDTPGIKTPPPQVPELNLEEAEIDILDIVAPQHKDLRKYKRLLREAQEKLQAELDAKQDATQDTKQE
eukprot:TRINITY_DN277_c0_g1_i1.p1 TRINITY_DN277_c0_g1~~TRINITY_DN277_c0_g1_i1.p1  ORF type:complete len:113 (+),score=31.04 TRINITY_DN277_c0_g1_i1:513-851(+)